MAVTVFYANNNMQDIGVLKGFKLDMTVSMETGDNDFEVRTSIGGIEMDEGYYIYAEGSEYGGVIDSKRINTKDKTLYYSGRTWRGMLESKIIQPPSGQDYYKASGDLNVVLDTLIDDFGLSDLFYADSVMTGVTVTDYQFYRYTDVYSGIIRLLSNLDYKLVIEFDTSELKCKIGAVPVVDYGENQEVTSDLYDFDIKKVGGTVNHLIGLGAGELKDRMVIHKYADANGTISDTQTLFGKDEVVAIYDYGSAESRQELEEQMLEQFQNMIGSDNIQITLNEIDADVGDKLTAYEENTEIEAIQYVQSKVVTIDDEAINVQHNAKTTNGGTVAGESRIKSNLDSFYPIGSIYISVNASFNPNTSFGGTWVKLTDKFLVGAGDTYALGATGGEATHTLTVNEIPSHDHQQQIGLAGYNGWPNQNIGYMQYEGFSNPKNRYSTYTTVPYNTAGRGGGQSHNNLPPYQAVFMWQRTA